MELGSTSSISSECRYEKALRLAEARLSKAARQPAAQLEAQLNAQALQAKQEAKERARQEWLVKFSGEKFAEFEERANALKTRHDQAQSHQRFQRAELQRRGDAQTRAAEVKADAIARQRADDEALNQEIASQRAARMSTNLSRATELQSEKVELMKQEQERVATRRSSVDFGNAQERAASCERRRSRQQKMDERLRAHSQHLETQRREKEVRFAQKREQADAEQRRREEIMERIRRLHLQSATKVDQLKELAWKASVTNSEDMLRQELEALVPRLSSAPTTPRSPGFTPCMKSPKSELGDRFIPAFQPSPRRLLTPRGSGMGSASPASVSSLSSRGSMASPRKPWAASQQSTQASLQAFAMR